MGLFGKKKEVEKQKSLDALALDYISDGVIILDANGIIQLVNPAAIRMIGQEAEEVIGVSFPSAVRLVDGVGRPVGEDANPVTISMKAQRGAIIRSLSVMSTKDNKAMPVELVVRLAGMAAILTLRDITRELKEEEERNDFISTASHEMRTPVASIEGFLGLAINPQTATVDERARGYLEQAHAASQRLGKLFQDLLDTTKLEDKRLVARPAPVELVALVKAVADAMEPMVTAKGLKYVFDSGGIAGAKVVAPVIYAMIDADFLWEVLENLIENAVKYTPKGEIKVMIRGEDANVTIGVKDTGIGIGLADLPHVFQKFYRADNSDTRTIGGTGLGLFIAKQRVEAMAGKMWVTSRVGEGSEFYFMLPRLSASEYEKRKLIQENDAKMLTKNPEVIPQEVSLPNSG